MQEAFKVAGVFRQLDHNPTNIARRRSQITASISHHFRKDGIWHQPPSVTSTLPRFTGPVLSRQW